LEKIGKEIAHPFISLLPEQEKISEKLKWYNPVRGILESSAVEIVLPIMYIATHPDSINLLLGGAIVIDGFWRANNVRNRKDPYFENERHYLGTNFLEIPWDIYKRTKKK
jgi:hypothetical protein